MEASLAYSAKKPILSDAEYDDLKKKLRKQNSRVVQQARALLAAGHLMVLDREPISVQRSQRHMLNDSACAPRDRMHTLCVWCMCLSCMRCDHTFV